MTEKKLSCNLCSTVWQKKGTTNCWSNDSTNGPPRPEYCPTQNNSEIIHEAFSLYIGNSRDAKIAFAAAKVEGQCYERIPDSTTVYPKWTRVEDTIAFAKHMGYKKIGIATCIGLLDETNRLSKILTGQGFEINSICCKTGSIDKIELNLNEKDKVRPHTFEPACNPIAQAKLLNKYSSDFNIIMGLCVGHDMLFAKYSEAPVTTLVVKDRVTGHNPVSVLYGQNFYYKRLQTQLVKIED